MRNAKSKSYWAWMNTVLYCIKNANKQAALMFPDSRPAIDTMQDTIRLLNEYNIGYKAYKANMKIELFNGTTMRFVCREEQLIGIKSDIKDGEEL